MTTKTAALLMILVFLPSCSSQPEASDTHRIQVTVSVLPQKYFVDRISGQELSVQVMVPPGYSPAVYEPTPAQMRRLSRSVLYLRIGHIPFEKAWIPQFRTLNSRMRIFDTSRGVSLIRSTHSHHPPASGTGTRKSGEEGSVDPHIWMSPAAVKVQVQNIQEALSAVLPDRKNHFASRTEALLAEIDALEREIADLFNGHEEGTFMVVHPAWSYFARDYRLHQVAIENEGKAPSPARLRELINLAHRLEIKTILVQSQFPGTSARTLADEINAGVVLLDPLAENWAENLRLTAQTIYQNLGLALHNHEQ